jgi:hypothetical protein
LLSEPSGCKFTTSKNYLFLPKVLIMTNKTSLQPDTNSNILPKSNILAENIIATRECYCNKHAISYKDELHHLPSGREIWRGCPKCYQIKKEIASSKRVIEQLKSLGLTFNTCTKKWSFTDSSVQTLKIENPYAIAKGKY